MNRVYLYPFQYITYGASDVGAVITKPTGAREYKIADHLGSTRVVLDESGTVINQTDYEPFGATVAVTGIDTRKKFIDKELDGETGTANHGVRQYDPEGPGFASVDPLWEKYPAWTPYHYSFNNPLGTKDPSGLDTTVGDAILDGLGDALDGIIYVLTSPTRPMVSEKTSSFPTLEGLGRMWNTAMGEYGTYAQTRLLVGVGAETAFWASLGGIEGAFARVARVEKTLQTTAHGAERIAGAAATRGGVLSEAGVAAVRRGGRVMTQADGATVRILQNEAGRFNVVVEGKRGIITTFENLSQKSLDRLGKNYGWK